MASGNQPKNMSLRVERYDYRLVFSKRGRARFISHLDLMRTFSRIFKRARIPVWFTQGFNPRLYIMFPLALPLGTESDVEIMDISLTERLSADELMNRINAAMPEGLRINKVTEPLISHKEIAASEYEIRFCFENIKDPCECFKKYISQEHIVVKKFSKKKGETEIDIKGDVKVSDISFSDGFAKVVMILPSGNERNINTSVVMDGFKEYAGEDYRLIYTTRTKILTKSGEIFT